MNTSINDNATVSEADHRHDITSSPPPKSWYTKVRDIRCGEVTYDGSRFADHDELPCFVLVQD
jgi:hypothetical protein